MASHECIARLGRWEGYELESSWEEQRGKQKKASSVFHAPILPKNEGRCQVFRFLVRFEEGVVEEEVATEILERFDEFIDGQLGLA